MHALIGQSMGCCAGKAMEKIACLLNYYIKSDRSQVSMGYINNSRHFA